MNLIFTRILAFMAFMVLTAELCMAGGPPSLKPVVKPYLTSYTQMKWDTRKDTLLFKQEKVIFGVNIKLNEHWSGRIGIDLINMNKPYFKPAVITYQKDRWTVETGIFFTSNIDIILSGFWGDRFIGRIAGDKYLLDPVADLGARVTYRWNEWLVTDLSLVAGNGYRHLKIDNHPRPAFRFIITPCEIVKIGNYISLQKNEVTETTITSFAHLEIKNRFKITGEYNLKTNTYFEKGKRLNTTSFYSNYFLTDWFSFMGRYDYVWSNETGSSNEAWHILQDGQALIGGFIVRCFPSVRLSANYQNWRPASSKSEKEDWLFVCLEFRY